MTASGSRPSPPSRSYFYVAFFLDRGRCVGRCGPVDLGCVARCAPRTLVCATLVMVLQVLLLHIDLSFVVAVLKARPQGPQGPLLLC
eukprot:m51a1_g13305 hypothetical protein (87) ;mRNA; f:134-463